MAKQRKKENRKPQRLRDVLLIVLPTTINAANLVLRVIEMLGGG
ncbi:hypothetical protein [Saccharothrix sp. HUAS TT1]